MTEVIEYIEKLEVLEATHKQLSTTKHDKDKLEDKTGKSQIKNKEILRENPKCKEKKRKRNVSDSDDEWYDK